MNITLFTIGELIGHECVNRGSRIIRHNGSILIPAANKEWRGEYCSGLKSDRIEDPEYDRV